MRCKRKSLYAETKYKVKVEVKRKHHPAKKSEHIKEVLEICGKSLDERKNAIKKEAPK